ncbi:MAG: GTP-binding protein [Pseudomonadota bacterium]
MMPPLPDIAETARGIVNGSRRAIAQSLNLLDDRREEATGWAADLFAHLPAWESVIGHHLIGLTGPPGAGKSTLISRLIAGWRGRGMSVAVLAADPSSPLTGGALLGDRLRMRVAQNDQQVFIRSLANRGSYGGLAAELLPMAIVMTHGFDRVVVETLGVGQREVDVAFTVDTTCLALPPGAGDYVQFLKAGIMEIPDVVVVTKNDVGAPAERTANDVSATAIDAPVVRTSATRGDGIEELIDVLNKSHEGLVSTGALPTLRKRASSHWLLGQLKREFGTYGIGRAGGPTGLEDCFADTEQPLLVQLARARDHLRMLFDGPSVPPTTRSVAD